MKWKHFPPLNSAEYPRELPAGTLLIQMIREPLAWIHSLVHNSYSMRSNIGLSNEGSKSNWLSQEVVLDSFENELANCRFNDAVDLWSCYAHGYLSGRFVAARGYPFVTIARHGDLVAYPVQVMQALESLEYSRFYSNVSTVQSLSLQEINWLLNDKLGLANCKIP